MSTAASLFLKSKPCAHCAIRIVLTIAPLAGRARKVESRTGDVYGDAAAFKGDILRRSQHQIAWQR